MHNILNILTIWGLCDIEEREGRRFGNTIMCCLLCGGARSRLIGWSCAIFVGLELCELEVTLVFISQLFQKTPPGIPFDRFAHHLFFCVPVIRMMYGTIPTNEKQSADSLSHRYHDTHTPVSTVPTAGIRIAITTLNTRRSSKSNCQRW